MADHGQSANRMQDLGHCRPHAGALTRRQNDRQQLGHACPFSTAQLREFYGRNVLGIHYIAAMVNYPKAPRYERLGGVWDLAKASDQFQARDVTFWGVFALVVWGVAVLGANLSALIPDSVLGGLHASRLGGATLNQLRGQIDSLTPPTALLKQENTVLVQRFTVNA